MNKQITIAICIIVVAALGMGVILPKYEDWQTKRTEAESKQLDLQNRKAYYEKVAGIYEELKNYSPELSKIDSALPEEISEPSILSFFQQKISESGLILSEIGQIGRSSSKSNPRLQEYNLDLDVSGSYSALKNFLLALEKSARIVEVERIAVSSPAAKTQTFSFNLSVKFYSY